MTFPLRHSMVPLVVVAVSTLQGCATTVTTVRTITPEEYGEQSWIGHTAEDVTIAWGGNGGREPDGSGGRIVTYRKVTAHLVPPAHGLGIRPGEAGGLLENRSPESQLPQGGSVVDVLATFWIGADGKVYRYWFDDEVYKKRLDAPDARPVAIYGSKTR